MGREKKIMHTIQLPLQNVSCEACEKVIGRILGKYPGARMESISKDGKWLSLSCEENDVSSIKEKLREHNYLGESAGSPRHVTHVLSHILNGTPLFRAEHELLVNVLLIFGALVAVLGGIYFFWFTGNVPFLKLWPVLALIPFGLAVNMGALLHVRQLCHHFTCTNGMMAGMTIGMIAGFMSGAILGATNGMFVGSVVGMFVGMSVSAWAVRKVGIMGIL